MDKWHEICGFSVDLGFVKYDAHGLQILELLDFICPNQILNFNSYPPLPPLFQMHIERNEPNIKKEECTEFIDADGVKWVAERKRPNFSLMKEYQVGQGGTFLGVE